MAHQALYRVYRPQTFNDVVEQQHIVTTLKNAVMSKNTAHAYLFCGTRGTGKTTMAKIFARAVNCIYPVDGNPCNECEICSGIIDGTILDVIEIDAASNNSVDNVRALIDEVVYTPTKASKKVYIIDEVHMLSIGAFNALLKTLEEPPEHVMFILATTEAHKMPATVLSRCQRFDFRRITNKGIAQRLLSIAQECGVALSNEAANFIASLAEGALRDGISILDQCISTGHDKLDLELVQGVIGVAPNEIIINTLDYLVNRQNKEVISQIDLIFSEGKDSGQYIRKLIQFLRDVLVYKTTNSLDNLYSMTEEEKKVIPLFAKSISMPYGLAMIRELSDLEPAIKWSTSQRILIEIAFLRICSLEMNNEEENTSNRIALLEEKIRQVEEALLTGAVNRNNIEMGGPQSSARVNEPIKPIASSRATEPSTDDSQKNDKSRKNTNQDGHGSANAYKEWNKVLDDLRSIGRMKILSCILNGTAVSVDENTVGIVLDEGDDYSKRILQNHENIEAIKEAIKRSTGKDMNVTVITNMEKTQRNSPEVPENVLNFAKKRGLELEIRE
ncbi:MAG TPA: DNA polymerase III subunit gamma/tau [Thermoclostridium sp.]|nr:DNA polymerase III subunit gamma/tau [Thermoclostridium sp.]